VKSPNKFVVKNQFSDCAQECAHTAGCFIFNEYSSSCELAVPHSSLSTAAPAADWVHTGKLIPYCTPFPFKDDWSKVTEVICKFRAEGWSEQGYIFLAHIYGHWRNVSNSYLVES